MGTSSRFGGPRGGTPLVPTWLEDGGNTGDAPEPGEGLGPGGAPPPIPLPPANRPLPLVPADVGRFAAARGNFSRFAGSGGNDRASLGRSISDYVSRTAGGARKAAQRMGTSRASGARLLSFLSDAQTKGATEALRALKLEGLAGRPIEEVFLGLVDYVCPEAGTIDEAIARDAFIETIADLASLGIADLDSLTAAQMQTVFELYATHAIEARICNDIGTKAVTLPPDLRAAERVQSQFRDFVLRGVSDAFTAAQTSGQPLTPDRVFAFVDMVYERAFEILKALGDTAAAR